jgi:hypothetical protein
MLKAVYSSGSDNSGMSFDKGSPLSSPVAEIKNRDFKKSKSKGLKTDKKA